MEYLPRAIRREERELFEERIPLYVELKRFGREDSIKKLIDSEKAKGMSVEDVINFCLEDVKDIKEKSVANLIESLLESGDYQIIVNEKYNIDPRKNIFDYVRGKAKKEIEGKERICYYADVLIAPAGEMR